MSSELHLDPLAQRLRRALTVSDEICERMAARVLQERPRRDGHRLALWAAAAILLLVGLGLWLRTALEVTPLEKAESRRAVADDGPWFLDIHPSDEATRGSAYDDEPALGRLLEECDGVVFGEVRQVGESIRFEVRFSQPKWIAAYARELPVDGAYPMVSCTRALTWKPGELAWLFLKRHPETRRLEVMYDGSGKITPPLWDMFQQDDIFELITQRRLSEERVAQLIERHGAQAVLYTESTISWFRGLRLDWSAPVLQAAVRNQLARFASDDEIAYPAALMRHVDPDDWRRIPSEARDGIRRRFDALDEEWSRLAWLEDLHLYQDAQGEQPYAADLDAFIDRAEADFAVHGDKTGYRERLRTAYRLLLDLDAPRAVRRLWELYETVEESFFWGPTSFLELLLDHDRERAEAELVRMSEKDRPKRRELRLDLLASCSGVAAERRFTAWMEDESFDFGSPSYRRQLERAFAEPDSTARFERYRPLFHRLLADAKLSIGELNVLVDIELTQSGDLTPALGAIRRALENAADVEREPLTELIRRVQRHLGVERLLWQDPRPEEAHQAARALLSKLNTR